MERSEHTFGDLVYVWYDPFNHDTSGWRGPAQTSSVDDGEGNITVRFHGAILDRRRHEVRADSPHPAHLATLMSHKQIMEGMPHGGEHRI